VNYKNYDAVVVGSGPNGLAAAIRLAQAGQRVLVLEAADTPGGGVRSAELTVPGVVHDVCSSVYPLGVCSPYLRTLPLREHGLEWVFPPAALAHPFPDGSAAVLYKSVQDTAATLGRDGPAYSRLMAPHVEAWRELFDDAIGPLRLPRHAFGMFRFGIEAMRSARWLAKAWFRTEKARAFFSGIAGHSMLPLEKVASAAPALVLAIAGHAEGWPVARGGSQCLTTALVSLLKSLGGDVVTGYEVKSAGELPSELPVLLDLSAPQAVKVAGPRFSPAFARKLKNLRRGMAAFKVDWALNHAIPWRAAECLQAGTIHLGESMEEISLSERLAWQGKLSDAPFVLLVQPTLFDPTRAPAGIHTAWAYCHVPYGYRGDALGLIENQIEKYAPGFRDCVIARSVMRPADLEHHNPNLAGGDISGGAPVLSQLFLRPTRRIYRTSDPKIFLCSSSTPPGPGVHGMCGYFAAEALLKGAKRAAR